MTDLQSASESQSAFEIESAKHFESMFGLQSATVSVCESCYLFEIGLRTVFVILIAIDSRCLTSWEKTFEFGFAFETQ